MSLIRWRRRPQMLARPMMRAHDLFDELDRLFSSTGTELAEEADYGPAVDVYETDDEVVVKAQLPGVKKEDVDVSIQRAVADLRGRALLAFPFGLAVLGGLLTLALVAVIGLSVVRSQGPTSEGPRERRRPLPTWLLLALGAGVGFGSALTGTGGPVLLVPLLLLVLLMIYFLKQKLFFISILIKDR